MKLSTVVSSVLALVALAAMTYAVLELRQRGVLTQAEFEHPKQRLLGI